MPTLRVTPSMDDDEFEGISSSDESPDDGGAPHDLEKQQSTKNQSAADVSASKNPTATGKQRKVVSQSPTVVEALRQAGVGGGATSTVSGASQTASALLTKQSATTDDNGATKTTFSIPKPKPASTEKPTTTTKPTTTFPTTADPTTTKPTTTAVPHFKQVLTESGLKTITRIDPAIRRDVLYHPANTVKVVEDPFYGGMSSCYDHKRIPTFEAPLSIRISTTPGTTGGFDGIIKSRGGGSSSHADRKKTKNALTKGGTKRGTPQACCA